MQEQGEQTIQSWNAILTHQVTVQKVEKGFIRNRVRTANKREREKGNLILTNQRLAWMQKRGQFSTSYHLTHEIPLTHLSGISMGGTLFKYVTLSDGESIYQFNLKNVGSKEFTFFQDMTMRQKEKASTVSVHPLQQVIKEVVMIPCQYCQSLMPQTSLPSNMWSLKEVTFSLQLASS